MQDYPGVPLSIAPGRFDARDYGRPVDVYSFGLLNCHLFEFKTKHGANETLSNSRDEFIVLPTRITEAVVLFLLRSGS
jgi:hypothetical protein